MPKNLLVDSGALKALVRVIIVLYRIIGEMVHKNQSHSVQRSTML